MAALARAELESILRTRRLDQTLTTHGVVPDRTLTAPTDEIGLSWYPGLENPYQSRRMIVDEEPVADILTAPVHGQAAPGESAQNHQRDELLGKLIWSVIVGTVRYDDGQAERVMPGAGKMVRRGFARGVR